MEIVKNSNHCEGEHAVDSVFPHPDRAKDIANSLLILEEKASNLIKAYENFKKRLPKKAAFGRRTLSAASFGLLDARKRVLRLLDRLIKERFFSLGVLDVDLCDMLEFGVEFLGNTAI